MKKILITGGTGLIGKELIKLLIEKKFDIILLSHSRKNFEGVKTFFWDWENELIDENAIDGIEYVIHLSGAGIADKRWSKSRKKLIINSRVKSAEFLLKKLREKNIKLRSFVSASAIGYYGAVTTDKIFNENDKHANDFIGETCFLWEKAAEKFRDISDRIVKLRIGVVLSNKGGALPKMIFPFKLGFGSPIGNGKQIMPWIHIEDMARLFLFSIENSELDGVFNAVATDRTTNKEFGEILSNVLNKPYFMPSLPSFLFKILFGEMSVLLTEGSKISNKKIKEKGFIFKFENLEDALKDLLIWM